MSANVLLHFNGGGSTSFFQHALAIGEINLLKAELSESSDRVKSLEAVNGILTQNLQAEFSRANDLSDRLEMASACSVNELLLAADNASLAGQNADLVAENNALKQENESLKAKVEDTALKQENESLKAENESLRAKLEDAERRRKVGVGKNTTLNELYTALKEKNGSLRKQLAEMVGNDSFSKQRLIDAQQRLIESQARDLQKQAAELADLKKQLALARGFFVQQ